MQRSQTGACGSCCSSAGLECARSQLRGALCSAATLPVTAFAADYTVYGKAEVQIANTDTGIMRYADEGTQIATRWCRAWPVRWWMAPAALSWPLPPRVWRGWMPISGRQVWRTCTTSSARRSLTEHAQARARDRDRDMSFRRKRPRQPFAVGGACVASSERC